MQEFENVRNEIPTYVIDRLESEWRMVQPQDPQLKAGLQTARPENTAPAASDSLGSLDK
ncbi:hypothetical protein [Rhizobium sp. P44RR-XXIV]|uniref:hypothetical protein n=1 Tax=Rhizobium sp. P44RR-XXIV TaxID=1921145 RepID=UPI00145A1D29|nr:hypothetical protein [Rhizobium sp. P44RR-XXIV]